jgi:predicted nucleotide-binding protein
MTPTRVFVGSSAAAKSQAKALIKKFSSPTLRFVPWWDAFTAGRTLLEDLDAIRRRVDAAVLLFSPEASSTVRGRRVKTPNLNVLFEFGYFYGHFGKPRVAIIKYGDYYTPSDLGGYIHIAGSSYFKRGSAVAVGKRTEREFERWAAQLGKS